MVMTVEYVHILKLYLFVFNHMRIIFYIPSISRRHFSISHREVDIWLEVSRYCGRVGNVTRVPQGGPSVILPKLTYYRYFACSHNATTLCVVPRGTRCLLLAFLYYYRSVPFSFLRHFCPVPSAKDIQVCS